MGGQSIDDVKVGRQRISTLTMGSGRDVVLVHGLGATKASFFDTAAALSRDGRALLAADGVIRLVRAAR